MNDIWTVRRVARIGTGWCMVLSPVVLVTATVTHARIVRDQTEQFAVAAPYCDCL